MEHFAGYGFNKSHSTAYAFLAYQTAYLKANYPWHFAAALLTIEAQNTDKLALYLGECRERGIPVLPPDINESQLALHGRTGKGVRFGLTAIKNVGEGAIESLLQVRAKQGRIASLHALCEDLDLRLVNKRVFESLVKAGAFDSLAQDDPALAGLPSRQLRPRLFAAIDAACEHGARLQRDTERRTGAALRRSAATTSDADGEPVDRALALPPAAAWTETEQLTFEKETLGLYWSGHPVDRYAEPNCGRSAPSRRRSSPSSRCRLTRGRLGTRRARSRSSPTRASAASSPRAGSSRRERAIAWRSSRSRTRRAASR